MHMLRYWCKSLVTAALCPVSELSCARDNCAVIVYEPSVICTSDLVCIVILIWHSSAGCKRTWDVTAACEGDFGGYGHNSHTAWHCKTKAESTTLVQMNVYLFNVNTAY